MSEERKYTYYELNREKCLRQAREYQKAHAQHYKDYWKVYYQENKDILREKHRAYRHKMNPPKPKAPPKEKSGRGRGRPPKPESEKPLRIPKEKVEKVVEPPPAPEPPIVIERQSVWVRFD